MATPPLSQVTPTGSPSVSPIGSTKNSPQNSPRRREQDQLEEINLGNANVVPLNNEENIAPETKKAATFGDRFFAGCRTVRYNCHATFLLIFANFTDEAKLSYRLSQVDTFDAYMFAFIKRRFYERIYVSLTDREQPVQLSDKNRNALSKVVDCVVFAKKEFKVHPAYIQEFLKGNNELAINACKESKEKYVPMLSFLNSLGQSSLSSGFLYDLSVAKNVNVVTLLTQLDAKTLKHFDWMAQMDNRPLYVHVIAEGFKSQLRNVILNDLEVLNDLRVTLKSRESKYVLEEMLGEADPVACLSVSDFRKAFDQSEKLTVKYSLLDAARLWIKKYIDDDKLATHEFQEFIAQLKCKPYDFLLLRNICYWDYNNFDFDECFKAEFEKKEVADRDRNLLPVYLDSCLFKNSEDDLTETLELIFDEKWCSEEEMAFYVRTFVNNIELGNFSPLAAIFTVKDAEMRKLVKEKVADGRIENWAEVKGYLAHLQQHEYFADDENYSAIFVELLALEAGKYKAPARSENYDSDSEDEIGIIGEEEETVEMAETSTSVATPPNSRAGSHIATPQPSPVKEEKSDETEEPSSSSTTSTTTSVPQSPLPSTPSSKSHSVKRNPGTPRTVKEATPANVRSPARNIVKPSAELSKEDRALLLPKVDSQLTASLNDIIQANRVEDSKPAVQRRLEFNDEVQDQSNPGKKPTGGLGDLLIPSPTNNLGTNFISAVRKK